MNIRNGIDNVTQLPGANAAAGVATAHPGAFTGASAATDQGLAADRTQLSNAANQVAQSAAASDVRLDKVAKIQNALDAGTYNIPASDVAQKIVSSMLTSE